MIILHITIEEDGEKRQESERVNCADYWFSQCRQWSLADRQSREFLAAVHLWEEEGMKLAENFENENENANEKYLCPKFKYIKFRRECVDT